MSGPLVVIGGAVAGAIVAFLAWLLIVAPITAYYVPPETHLTIRGNDIPTHDGEYGTTRMFGSYVITAYKFITFAIVFSAVFGTLMISFVEFVTWLS